jgi:uncharacterized oligopeptide transporter (OPT) family protein
VVWLFVVSILGIVVAAGLRSQLLEKNRLPFPSGIVTAETLQEIHRGGRDAAQRLRLLAGAAACSAGLKLIVTLTRLGPIAPSLKLVLPTTAGGTAGGSVATVVSPMNLGFAIDPSFLMIGFGMIAGIRIGLSILLGAIVGWAVLAPVAVARGWVHIGASDINVSLFGPLVEWLLWPGATLMVTGSLTSFAIFALRSYAHRRAKSRIDERKDGKRDDWNGVRSHLPGFAIAFLLCVAAQVLIFDIGMVEASLAVVLSYVLAVVAARVSGETAITPIGALGKITQLTFGVISPGNVTANLMTANVTGGAAGQCADLMHDLRTGQLIGATPRFQIVAQSFGVLAGSLVAAGAYMLLITDPQHQLLTPEWPAPAVATWKAVAEVMSKGLETLPPAAAPAIAIAAVGGVIIAVLEAVSPSHVRQFIPSAAAMGLGFVIPAWNAISMCLGAIIAVVITRWFPAWAKRRLVIVAAGLIVGESLAGVAGSILLAR